MTVNIMHDEFVTIAANEKVNDKYYKLTFRSKNLSSQVKPGQFMNVAVEGSLDPFLRRPFSYYRVQKDSVEILYEILGRATGMLTQKKKGDTLQVMGPLGKPFTMSLRATEGSEAISDRIASSAFQPPRNDKRKRVLVAGGVGVPPLIYLAEEQKMDYLLIGTKSKAEVMPSSELAKVQAEVLYSTNDGSFGEKGYVAVLLEKVIKKEAPENIFVQTCGPNVMMQAVMDICEREGIEGEASLDKTMACGIGVCLGCMVKTPRGWVPSCTEGPVFNFKEIECIS